MTSNPSTGAPAPASLDQAIKATKSQRHVVFRGHMRAYGFVFDVPRIGVAEARRRLLEVIDERTVIRLLPNNRWVVLLHEPKEIRSQRAPGLPLQRIHGRYVSAPDPPLGSTADLGLFLDGSWNMFQLATLPLVEPSAWLGIAATPRQILCSLTVPPEPAVAPIDQSTPAPRPNARAAAKIGAPNEHLQRLLAALGKAARSRSDSGSTNAASEGTPRQRWSWFRRGNAAGRNETIPQHGRNRRRFFGRARSNESGVSEPSSDHTERARLSRPRPRSGAGTRAQSPGKQIFRNAFTRLLLRTPASGALARKHQKYLRELERLFDQGKLEEALRNAIAIGDGESAGLTLSLPSRRGNIDASRFAGGPSRTVPWGANVGISLQERYRQAAKRLEAERRIYEAAFVYVDLLNAVDEGIALLERHGEWRFAAELAEGHRLTPAMQVRLWWKAGDHERAVRIAKRYGAFQDAITFAQRSDPELARMLRAQWVRSLSVAGSYLAAVEAAWSDEQLRAEVAWAIDMGIQIGGPQSAALRAYRLSAWPSELHRAEAQQLLASTDDSTTLYRETFVQTFSKWPCADPVADREMASASLRALIRLSGTDCLYPHIADDARQLLLRCDPILRSDAPSLTAKARPVEGTNEPITIALRQPGTMPVRDVAPLPDGSVLVALGELGVRLVNRRGSIAANWSTPTNRIVLADHGGKALLLNRMNHATEVHQLDLVDRKVRRWATLELNHVADTYDGDSWITSTRDGIAVFDTTALLPTIVWRELQPEDEILAIQRTDTFLSATIRHAVPGPEVWTWALPSFTLRNRVTWDGSSYVLGDGETVQFLTSERDVHVRFGSRTYEFVHDNDGECRTISDLLVSGNRFATITQTTHNSLGTFDVHIFAGSHINPIAIVTNTAPAASLRCVGDRIALFDGSGEIVTFHHRDPANVSLVRLTT